MWICLGLATLSSVLTVLENRDSYYLGTVIVRELLELMIALALVLWFTRMLSTGRNWMRLLITILFVIGCAALVYGVAMDSTLPVLMFAVWPIRATLLLAQLALAAIVVVLINTPPSRRWFQARIHDAAA